MRNYFKNNKGLTLVEILAALVLLSIVLITFMTFFTQSAKFTANNQETLTAVQVGEDVVSKVRDIQSLEELTLEPEPGFEFEKFDGDENLVSSETFHSDYYISIKKEGSLVASKLQRVEITVLPKKETIKSSSPFTTEMYIEVNP
ncbi:type II secretion system GspH family protein [Planococcus sp. MERTA32b]|nr:type II secretion system GspH family protein [Planococcus sp. MER TA 32b]